VGTVRLMEYEWSENPREVDYHLPDSWEVTVHHIAGFNRPVLTGEQTRQAIASPIGSPSIKELAKGKRKVCILFDDMARGTPASAVVPHVLAELHEGGVTDDAIEFICALGAHEAWDRSLLVRKLGGEIVNNYKVYNHTPFMNCTYLGKTSFGTRVEINSEVMSCDLKIAISGCVPHPSYGFGGGGKAIMPGVASFDSICGHHRDSHKVWNNSVRGTCDGKGVHDGNPQPKDAIEFARMARLDFSINCLLNEKAQIVAILAGEVGRAYDRAVVLAKEHYVVADTRDNDIVIANAYCKANEAAIASGSAFLAVKRSGGSAVTIANSHLGQIGHYLSGTGFGFGGRRRGIPAWVNHNIFFSEFPEARTGNLWAEQDLPKLFLLSDWVKVIAKLTEWHGPRARVAVFPDGTIQYVNQPENQKRLADSKVPESG
jgi:lactate racemase